MRYIHQTHLVDQWPFGKFDRKMPPSWRSADRGTKATEKTGTQQTQNPRELLPHTVPNTSLELFPGKHQHNFSTEYSKMKEIILRKNKNTKRALPVFKSAQQTPASQKKQLKPSWLLVFWKRSQHTEGHG